jgi:hypothetical protein
MVIMLYGIINGSSRNVFLANAAQRNRYPALARSNVVRRWISSLDCSSYLRIASRTSLLTSPSTIPKEQIGKSV